MLTHSYRWTLPCSVVLCLGALFVQSVVSDSGFITYTPGNISIILTSPHGGRLRPPNIRDRLAGCWDPANQDCVYVHDCAAVKLKQDFGRCWVVYGSDGNTNNLTGWISDAIFDATGRRPYIIINQLHRLKLDANRLAGRAAFGDPIAVSAWEDWHRYINQAKASIGGAAVLLDIHAHDHREGDVELGYLISGPKLDANQLQPNISSIRHLASRTNTPFEELLRGVNSLGTFLSEEGYSTVPSVRKPGPSGASYFYGGTTGTNTATHGSKDGGVVDAIQVETPARVLMNPNTTKVIEYAGAVARSVVRFHRLYYTSKDQGPGGSAMSRASFCARPRGSLGLFYACLLCPKSQLCDRRRWSGSFQFNQRTPNTT